MIKKEAKEIFEGEVREVLPNLLFRLKLDDGREVLATLKGKMKLYRIKVIPGDRVRVELSTYDEKRGWIVYRL